MATEKQVEANRRNAALSTGPRTEAGKARCRANATTHGLAAVRPEIEAEMGAEGGLCPAFAERRMKWEAETRPEGEVAGWALDCAVAASLRIDRCGRAMDTLIEATRERARLSWDEDRAVSAAEAFGRLARNPVLAARQLRTTLAGAFLLIDAWNALGEALGRGDWTEAESSRALDLLGAAPDLREGRTAIDPPGEDAPPAFRRSLVDDEVASLLNLVDRALIPLEAGECRRAMEGDLALISKPGKLLARYERDAWRRYRESMARVGNPAQASTLSPAPAPIAAKPVAPVAAPPARRRVEVAAVDEGRAFEAERRAVQAEMAAFLEESRGRFAAVEGEDATVTPVAPERPLDGPGRRKSGRDGTKPISRLEPAQA